MKEKRLRDKFYHTSDQELTFTKEDRNEVFEQIHQLEKNNAKKRSIVSYSKKFAPLSASLLVIGLCIFLFIASNLPGNLTNEIRGNSGSNASESVIQADELFLTALLMVKDDNDRIPINLLLTYSKEKNRLKVLSLPRDTYAPILGNDGTIISYEKLTHAYIYGSEGGESVSKTVSKLFDLPIDYYAVIDLETLSTMVDSVNGIVYNLQEDIQVRAISTEVFEFKKGTHRVNGEEVVALLMDATVGSSLGEEDQLSLINTVIDQLINGLPQTQLNQYTTKIEGNIPQLFEDKMELPSIQLVSLIDGIIPYVKTISDTEGKYYIKFEKEFLNSISEELTTFN